MTDPTTDPATDPVPVTPDPTDPTQTGPSGDPQAPSGPLRFVSRFLQQTVAVHLRDAMQELGWLDTPNLFGSDAFRLQLGRMSEKDLVEVKPNTVAITFGEEPPAEEQELGGGLVMSATMVAVDVIPDTEALGLAFADDIRDVLTGRLTAINPTWRRAIALRDFTTDAAGVPRQDFLIEFIDVVRRRADQAEGRTHWQQVVANIELTMPGWE